MKHKLMACTLAFVLCLMPLGAFAEAGQASEPKQDVLHEMFSGIDEVSPDDPAAQLPYLDGTVLSDVREPLYVYDGGSKLFGDSASPSENLTWKSASAAQLAAGAVTVGGKTYNLSNTYKLLSSGEGDLNGDGRKNELAVLAAAKTTDNRSLLLLCTAEAQLAPVLVPIAVLYDSSTAAADFYADANQFVNAMSVVCADLNGDGYDEIVTTTPTNGFGDSNMSKYGFDNFGGSYLWSLTSENRTAESFKTASGWNQNPRTFMNSLLTWPGTCYIGAPGVTASVAAADIDGDGCDDLVTAICSDNVQYNANYASNMLAVYYIGGDPDLSNLWSNRKILLDQIANDVKTALRLNTTTGDASGVGVAICDIDGSGKPTVFLSLKETLHHWSGYNGDKMLTPSYYVLAMDYQKDKNRFTSSTVYHGGMYKHGWLDRASSQYVYKTDLEDSAPIRIGVLQNDFGRAAQAEDQNFVSSGTLVVDQKLIPFVRYPDGNTYRYDAKDIGSFTGSWGADYDQTVYGFAGTDCIFYDNGTYVTDIRTANISFDESGYRDAALVRAYTSGGKQVVYYLAPNGSGYTMHPTSAQLGSSTGYGIIAMPDTDADSIYLQYQKHVFFWADPVIITALASPPYFGSLPSDMYINSQTTYGRSTMTAGGATESFSVSAGIYISTEIKAGHGGTAGVFESESEAMQSSTIDKEKTREVTYTQSFSTSGGEDTVVLTTIGYDAYAYTAYYPGTDGKLASSDYVVYVPRDGSDAIKTATLTYEDYLAFRPYANGALPDLSDVFSHTIGEPDTYPMDTPNHSHVLSGSVMSYPRTSTFPSNLGSQTMSIDITEQTSETTSAGSSVSTKIGGGIEAEAEGIFNLVDVGTKVTVGSSTTREHESGRITTSAVGTSFEGTVFGQGDGMNVSGSGEQKADFNWRLLHYIYNAKEGDRVQQFPVVTYILSGVKNPGGVVPNSVTVSPIKNTIEQVGPATPNFESTAEFSVIADGVTREAYTALEDAPQGMTLKANGNVAQSGAFYFGISINSNVQPGTYNVRLNVGGKRSDPFPVIVTPYTAPVWLDTDVKELDFGSVRVSEVRGTPAAAAQTVTVSNLHTEALQGLTASMQSGDDSPFTVTTALSSPTLAAKGTSGDTATVQVAPKKGLGVGTHTDTLIIQNAQTKTPVALTYTVTSPTIPSAPYFANTWPHMVNPIQADISAPKDDGGARIQYYLYTLKDHASYLEADGTQKWKRDNATDAAQAGSSFTLKLPDTLTVGESYTLGVKAVNSCGESAPGWFTFTVDHAEDDPGEARNPQIHPFGGGLTVTWDAPAHWGENEYVSDVGFKTYNIWLQDDAGNYINQEQVYEDYVLRGQSDRECTFTGLTNGKTYSVTLQTRSTNRYTEVYLQGTPTADAVTPSRPAKLKAEMSYRQAVLSWEAPASNGNAAITGYKVSKDGGTSWTSVGAATTCTLTDLKVNQAYTFMVCAENSAGTGAAATTLQTVPHKLSAPNLDTVIAGYEQLEAVWTPPENETVIGYEARLDEGVWQAIEPITINGKLHYIFDGLQNGHEYAVEIRAVDAEGGGIAARGKNNALSLTTPQEEAPRKVQNVRVQARNGGIQLYGAPYDEADSMRYMVGGHNDSWYTFDDGRFIGYLENGKTYTVGITSTRNHSQYGHTLQTAQYFTVTPSASEAGAPSGLSLQAALGTDYLRLEWALENDGGDTVEYHVALGNDSDHTIVLPAEVTTLTLPCTVEERSKNYSYIEVTAQNSVDSVWSYVYPGLSTVIEGDSILTAAKGHGTVQSTPYKLVGTYWGEDESGNMVPKTEDISDSATWSLTSPNTAISWDAESRRIVIGADLPDGIYEAVVCAKDKDHGAIVFEHKITIYAGETARLFSADVTGSGLSVSLQLPQSFGNALLCTATYDASGRLLTVVRQSVSPTAADGGSVSVSVAAQSAKTARVMLLQDAKSMRPLCPSLPVSLQ